MTNFSILWNTFNSSTYSSKVSVVVTTDEGSPLWDFAQNQQMDSLAIPACIGGRFSVFSVVGLFPLFWFGFDVREILHGAQAAITDNFNTTSDSNHARQMALIKYYAYQNNHHILNMFTFSPLLESFGKWYRQLIGESIPKKRSNGQPTPGITPMVSIGTTDLHSVSQLFLAGPNDKLHVLISNEAKIKDMQIPNSSAIEALCPIIANQSINHIMKSITKGVKSAFDQRNLPSISLKLPGFTPSVMGYIMQLHMMETMYLAALFGVNAFDQPNVEEYKNQTIKSLTNPDTKQPT